MDWFLRGLCPTGWVSTKPSQLVLVVVVLVVVVVSVAFPLAKATWWSALGPRPPPGRNTASLESATLPATTSRMNLGRIGSGCLGL